MKNQKSHWRLEDTEAQITKATKVIKIIAYALTVMVIIVCVVYSFKSPSQAFAMAVASVIGIWLIAFMIFLLVGTVLLTNYRNK